MALIWLLIVQVQLQISCHSTTKGVGICSTGQDRTAQDRTAQDRTGQDSTGQERTGQDVAMQDSTVQCRSG